MWVAGTVALKWSQINSLATIKVNIKTATINSNIGKGNHVYNFHVSSKLRNWGSEIFWGELFQDPSTETPIKEPRSLEDYDMKKEQTNTTKIETNNPSVSTNQKGKSNWGFLSGSEMSMDEASLLRNHY